MPIYEYQCNSCGHTLEALQKISAEPLKDCPECKKAELSKLISAASFRLKGAGWYETDFKTGDKKQLAESDSASKKAGSDATATSTSTSAENKPKAGQSAGKSAEKSAGSSEKPASKA